MAEVIFRLPGREQYSYAEVKFNEDELTGPDAESAQELLKTALESLNAVYPNSGTSSAPQGAQQSSGGSGGGKNCVHGVMELKSGGSGNRQWSAYMCPSKDRDSRCQPIDAKTGKAWERK